MFESEYAKCEYMEKDRTVLHVWKKEAHYDDYRKPVKASLEMLKDHGGSVFITVMKDFGTSSENQVHG